MDGRPCSRCQSKQYISLGIVAVVGVCGLIAGAIWWKTSQDEEELNKRVREQIRQENLGFQKMKEEDWKKEVVRKFAEKEHQQLVEQCMSLHFEDQKDAPVGRISVNWSCYLCGGKGGQFTSGNVTMKCRCCNGTGSH